MFELQHVTNEGTRSGRLRFDGKQHSTPCFFMTSNFGGGASDVYRIVTYTDLLEGANTPILYNYYYLTVGGTFKVKWTGLIPCFRDINDFILFIRDEFFKRGYVVKNYPKVSTKWNPITMLDSGSGNFLRDLAKAGVPQDAIIDTLNNEIPKFVDFCNDHAVNIMIAMDFARKYTYKQGEDKNKFYHEVSKQFSADLDLNLRLLDTNLNILKQRKKNFIVFAPVHGASPKQYREFVRRVLQLEEGKGIRFDGFALGGLADYKSKENTVWGVPLGANARIKAGIVITSACKVVREELTKQNDVRPIHALGVGDVDKIIPLVSAGADTFDCHAPWRRATDGNMEDSKNVFGSNPKGSFSKFLIPLLDSEMKIIASNNRDVLEYVRLPDVNDSVTCNCSVCRKYSINEMKQMYSNGDEEYYLARILMYVHAVLQHDLLCARLKEEIESNNSILNFVEQIPDPVLKEDLLAIISFVSKKPTLF